MAEEAALCRAVQRGALGILWDVSVLILKGSINRVGRLVVGAR